MDGKHRFLHGTLEATIFHATPYTPPFPFNVRDSQTGIPHARGVKLGDLLKRKAEEGVAVRIMLWNDETSLPIIQNKGLMRTHDEDAFAFFKHTQVICRLCPRLHNKFPTCFAHHQKTLTMDCRGLFTSSNREIMSFIGGFDLCDGRYDTKDHSLFRTLNAELNYNDFYQASLSGASLRKGGPREPWHDTHACIIGEAAWDVLKNFEQRWKKQCDHSLLVPIKTVSGLCHQYNQTSISHERDWKVQVFRSIDHMSATPISENFTVEQSIQEAYVEAIRRAEKFIYIENQYFIGGCHLWDKDQNCGCRNLIPVEIALKVASKVRSKERFSAYIVIPMWPEGVPESESVQDILNFFCLANREEKGKEEFVPPDSPHPFSCSSFAFHSSVDDTYMLIGSANVNQRSMDGQRDTEIAIGCYQL